MTDLSWWVGWAEGTDGERLSGKVKFSTTSNSSPLYDSDEQCVKGIDDTAGQVLLHAQSRTGCSDPPAGPGGGGGALRSGRVRPDHAGSGGRSGRGLGGDGPGSRVQTESAHRSDPPAQLRRGGD